MTIFTVGPNCFKAREMTEDSGTIDRMLEGMRERGVQVEVIEDKGSEKEFCIH